MKATFQLDPCHVLEVKSVGARDISDPGVLLTVTYAPLGFSGHCADGVFVDETPKGWSQGMHFQPSYARAIASAILSAATEARA